MYGTDWVFCLFDEFQILWFWCEYEWVCVSNFLITSNKNIKRETFVSFSCTIDIHLLNFLQLFLVHLILIYLNCNGNEKSFIGWCWLLNLEKGDWFKNSLMFYWLSQMIRRSNYIHIQHPPSRPLQLTRESPHTHHSFEWPYSHSYIYHFTRDLNLHNKIFKTLLN